MRLFNVQFELHLKLFYKCHFDSGCVIMPQSILVVTFKTIQLLEPAFTDLSDDPLSVHDLAIFTGNQSLLSLINAYHKGYILVLIAMVCKA